MTSVIDPDSNDSAESEIEPLNLKLNERKVLYGLIAYPSRRDTEICQKLDMRKSTFSTIKNRLENQKTFRRIILPGFPRI
ncbi:MAG: MarR family transcriptional regulator, partial [Candidatus Hodarchaeales archaeon]